jgi:hypothetical protein
MVELEESELAFSKDFAELRIMRMFKPSRMPAAIPNRSAGAFWGRTMVPGMYACHNSNETPVMAGIKESNMMDLRFKAATGMVATDA